MNSRQRKKILKKSLFHDYETKGRKIYSYAVARGNLITIGFTAKPKQKGCRAAQRRSRKDHGRLL